MKGSWGTPEPEDNPGIVITPRQYRALNRRYRNMRRQRLMRQFGRPALVALGGCVVVWAVLSVGPLLFFNSSPSVEVVRNFGPFRNCAAARAAGAAPIYRGQPGYASHLDADGDGIACEPWIGHWFR